MLVEQAVDFVGDSVDFQNLRLQIKAGALDTSEARGKREINPVVVEVIGELFGETQQLVGAGGGGLQAPL